MELSAKPKGPIMETYPSTLQILRFTFASALARFAVSVCPDLFAARFEEEVAELTNDKCKFAEIEN